MKKIIVLLLLFSTSDVFSQDVIVKLDGTTVLSKIVEIGTTEVKYKKYTNLDGPMYTIKKSDILSINYENGEKESFGDEMNNSNKNEITEEYRLEAGTNIPLQNVRHLRAAELSKGQEVEFQVSRDVKVGGITVIPFGTSVYGTVYLAKRSSWFGTKGKLGISVNKISIPNGVDIPLNNGDLYVTGKNRTALSVCLFLFALWPCCFITGSKAEIPANYPTVAKIANPVIFKNEGEVYIPKLVEGLDNNLLSFPFYANIKLKNNRSIDAQIISEDDENIIYKHISKPNGRSYALKKDFIEYIDKY